MIAYKLLTQAMKSYGDLQWTLGETKTVNSPGNEMCTNQVLHCYSHPLMAAMFNCIHAKIENPRLFEIKIPEIVACDSSKQASKSQTLLKELTMPKLSDKDRQEVAIRCALLLPNPSGEWVKWAENWLNGSDRTLKAQTQAQAQAYAQTQTQTYAETYAQAYAQACARARAYACARVYACAHARACACAHACAYAPSTTILTFLLQTQQPLNKNENNLIRNIHRLD